MPSSEKSAVIPSLRYRDAHAAINFLCEAFGFEKQAVYEGEGGRVAHAELVLGGGMIMLGSHPGHGDYDKLVQPPARTDALNTHGIYVIVDDCRTHYECARRAGAVIVLPLEDKDYGGASYTCRDPWGYVWSFGSFDPWAPALPQEPR